MSSEEDTKRSLRRQLEEKSDIVGRLQLEIQQLVDRINSMETQHSVELGRFRSYKHWQLIKPAFHDADADTDTNILARILADTSDTHDFLKLFPWQAERRADILTTILARISVSASWNAGLTYMFNRIILYVCRSYVHFS